MSIERKRDVLNKIFKQNENPYINQTKGQSLRIDTGNNINKQKRMQRIMAAGGPAAKRRIEVKEKKL